MPFFYHVNPLFVLPKRATSLQGEARWRSPGWLDRTRTRAAGSLALAGLICWTMSRPEVVVGDGLIRALYYLVFLTGGVGHIRGIGPVLAELATLVLVWPEAAVVLPIVRFTGFIWLIVVGALLPKRRTDRRRYQLRDRAHTPG